MKPIKKNFKQKKKAVKQLRTVPTKSELEFIRMLSLDMDIPTQAQKTGIAYRALEKRAERAKDVFHVHTAAGLVAKAFRERWLDPNDR